MSPLRQSRAGDAKSFCEPCCTPEVFGKHGTIAHQILSTQKEHQRWEGSSCELLCPGRPEAFAVELPDHVDLRVSEIIELPGSLQQLIGIFKTIKRLNAAA